ncbi:uncharacterized protein [Ptychodera flava]|uniref:uncharacterized protein n=1 Tax=Ptychodera flava TaxID=63121 RepID=UPI00396A1CFE
MAGNHLRESFFIFICLISSVKTQESEQLTDMEAVKDALLAGYPLKYFADYTKCARTPVVTIPGVDIEEPSDYGTTIDSFRGLRDVTGAVVQLTFTTTEVVDFPGIPEHVIVYSTIQAFPDGRVTSTTQYIERDGLMEVGNSINNCALNDGSNGEGVFIYKNTFLNPVRLTTYEDIESSFIDGYSIRYMAVFTKCGEFNTGFDTLGGGLIPLYYLKRGEKIIASIAKFYNSPFALNQYVVDTFKVDIWKNMTMQVALSAISVDDFSQRYTDEVYNCPLIVQTQSPPAVVFRMAPRT